MPEIKLRNQPFDVVFSPTDSVLCAALLTGEIKSWRYDDDGETSKGWSTRPTKRTARALHFSGDGKEVWMGGKSGIVAQVDASSGKVKWDYEHAHNSPVNRVFCVNEQLVASGDDEGVIKFWDPRAPKEPIRQYEHHWDYISDFTYFEDKRTLVATSGDGHLSAIDVRSSKPEPSHQSADQEDELLSITQIKGGEKFVVGTGLGVLSVWNRKLGWDDSVDRMMGHPASVDAVVALTEDIIATGSEDGMVRVIQIQPNTFLGVVATHDEYPIERLALDRNDRWLASVSHDECIKLTDCEGMFEDDSGAEDADMGDGDEDNDVDSGVDDGVDEEGDTQMEDGPDSDEDEDKPAKKGLKKAAPVDWGSDSDEDASQPKKKVRKGQHKVGKDKVNDTSEGFFDGL